MRKKNTGLEDGERIIIEIANLISGNGMIFALIAGVILAGILAATRSTADLQLLAASTSVSEDIIGSAFRVKISDKKRIIISRCPVVVIAVIAMVLARKEDYRQYQGNAFHTHSSRMHIIIPAKKATEQLRIKRDCLATAPLILRRTELFCKLDYPTEEEVYHLHDRCKKTG